MLHYLVAVHVLLFLLKEKKYIMQNHNNYLSKNQAKLNNLNKHTNLGKKEKKNNLNLFPYFIFSDLLNMLFPPPLTLILTLGFIVSGELEGNLEFLIAK